MCRLLIRGWLFLSALLAVFLLPSLPSYAQSSGENPLLPKTVGEKSVELSVEERAWLDAHPGIAFGYTDLFEPAVIVNNDGTYRGTLVDLLELLNQRLGTDFALTIKHHKVIFKQVAQKELAGIISMHPDNADKRGYLKTGDYMFSYPTVFTRKGVPFSRPGDLAGKKIAIIDNIFFSQNIVDLYGEGATVIKVKSGLEGLERVKDGTVDLFIGSSRNSYLLVKYQFFDLVAAFEFYDHPTPNVMAVRNDWPQLVAILNKGLAAISTEEMEAIQRKWFIVPEKNIREQLTTEENSWLAENHRVRVRVADWPPYQIVKEDQPPQGIAIEYLKLIGRRTGINFEYQVTKQPFAAFLDDMRERKGPDMTSIIAPSPERRQYLSFSDPYFYSPWVIIAREKQKILLDIHTLADKTLALPRSFIMQQLVARDYPQIRVLLFDNDEQALFAVSTGKADAYIGNLTVSSHIIHRSGLSNLQVVGSTPYGEQILSMGNRRDWPELTSIINKALASITEEEKTAIRSKYVAIQYDQGGDRGEVIKWILIVVLAGIVILLMFAVWNWQLRRNVRERTVDLETEIVERTQAEKRIVQYQDRLKALASQLTVVEDVERKRIATGLHDHIGQILAVSRIQLAQAQKKTGDDQQLVLLDGVSQSLLRVIEDTRALIFDLSSPLLNEIGLDAAIGDWLENRVKKEYDLEYSYTQKGEVIVLSELEKTILFRNFKELVINVMKHAQASKIDVQLDREQKQLRLSVRDDGSGYDAGRLDIKTNSRGGFGLFSIHERMADIGGELVVISEIGKGCTATLILPVDKHKVQASV